jgi:hypothetical protein
VTDNRGFSSGMVAAARRAVLIVGLTAHLGRGLQRVATTFGVRIMAESSGTGWGEPSAFAGSVLRAISLTGNGG